MKGTMSVFLGLLITMVMSLFFSMTEVIRYVCIESESKSSTYLATQNIFGEYQRLLYDNYGILAVDTTYGTGESSEQMLIRRACRYMEANQPQEGQKGVDLLQFGAKSIQPQEIVYLTDGEGAAFIKEASAQMLADLPQEVLDQLTTVQQASENAEQNAFDLDTVLSDTEDQLLTLPEENSTDDTADDATGTTASDSDGENTDDTTGTALAETTDEGENFLEAIIELKDSAILSQVLPDTAAVSQERLTTEARVSGRSLQQGSGTVGEVTPTERLLYQYYLLNHFGSYLEKKDHGGLSYEQEYILCGKDSDVENLTSTVERLLGLREVENLISLAADKAKVAEAHSIAAAASAVVLNPELEPAIAYGLMAAWAYFESVLDVRLLLSGGRVALIKTPEEWTSHISDIVRCADTSFQARESVIGIGYREYMFALYCVEGQRNVAYRGLDMVEESLHRSESGKNVKADALMAEGVFVYDITASPLFLSFVPLFTGNLATYSFHEEHKMSYF